MSKEYSILDSFSFGFGNVKNFPGLIILVFFYSLIRYLNNYLSYIESNHIFNISLHFGLPWGFPELTNFYSFPEVHESIPEIPSTLVGHIILYTLLFGLFIFLVKSVLEAGYLGNICVVVSQENNGLDFFGNIKKYGLRILLFNFIFEFIALVLVVVGLTFATFPSIGFYFGMLMLLGLLLGFLFSFAPYIIVLDNETVYNALKKSITIVLSIDGVKYLILFASITAVTSVAISILLIFPVIGYILSMGVVSIVGVALTIAATHFYNQAKTIPQFQNGQ